MLTRICSGLLAWRIWTIERNVAGARMTKSPTMHILRVIMDAAILYSVALFIALVCFVISNDGELVMLYMVIPPLISIHRTLLNCSQLGPTDHLDCLLHGAYSHCNP
jgi:hypothetical protein